MTTAKEVSLTPFSLQIDFAGARRPGRAQHIFELLSSPEKDNKQTGSSNAT